MLETDFDAISLDPEGFPGQCNFVHRRIWRAATGFITGGAVGGVVGAITSPPTTTVPTGTTFPATPTFTADPCPRGVMIGGRCVEADLPFIDVSGPDARSVNCTRRLNDIVGSVGMGVGQYCLLSVDEQINLALRQGGGFRSLRVGTQATTGATWQTGAEGMFGALSAIPVAVQTQRLVCPPRLVLGIDNRCYAKGTIPRNLRKWIPARKPPVSAADAKCIRKAAAAVGRVKRLAVSTGRLSVKNK